MRYNKLILPIALALCLLPLRTAGSAAAAANEPGAQGFKILLSDGSILKGAVSFTLNIDTQYGRLTVPSTNFISADFDPTGGWAEIRTKAIQLRVQYKPENSALQVTTDVGPVNVDLTKVVSVATLYPEVPNGTLAASNPYEEANQVPASPSDMYSQPATSVDLTPYEYGAPAPYYWPSYYPTEPFSYTDEYPYYWWPDFGFAVITDFDHEHHRHHEGFGNEERFRHDEGFRNEIESRGFHVAWNGRGTWQSAMASGLQFNRTAGLSPGTSGRAFSSGRTFSAPTFRSESTPSFSTFAAPTFRSAPTPSSWSGGMRFSSGGFAHSSGFGGYAHSGGFSGGGFGGHGGGRGR